MSSSSPMIRTRCVVSGAALILTLTVGTVSAQDPAQYRGYVLESSVDTVVSVSGGRTDAVRTLHERPAMIQEVRWRPTYLSPAGTLEEPVREIIFTFVDDALYQLLVSYDRARTEGLTDGDMLEALSTVYGAPSSTGSQAQVIPTTEIFAESVVLGRWESAKSSMVLLRRTYAPEYQLVLLSSSLNQKARSAIREAVRLDEAEAPLRASERRKKEADDANAIRDKARTTNKATFRP